MKLIDNLRYQICIFSSTNLSTLSIVFSHISSQLIQEEYSDILYFIFLILSISSLYFFTIHLPFGLFRYVPPYFFSLIFLYDVLRYHLKSLVFLKFLSLIPQFFLSKHLSIYAYYITNHKHKQAFSQYAEQKHTTEKCLFFLSPVPPKGTAAL